MWWHFLVWPAHLVLKRFFGLRDEEQTGALRALLQKGLKMLGWCGESGDVEQLQIHEDARMIVWVAPNTESVDRQTLR